jgi:nucleoside-triphosphatase THEP1
MITHTNPHPADLLDSLLNQPASQLVVVTGQSGTGKTAWCSALVDEARMRSLTVVGVLSPPIFKEGVKVGIDLTDLATGETNRLAGLRVIPLKNQLTRKWQFDDNTVEWGNRVLNGITNCAVLIVDELGPLEFVHAKGLMAGLDVVERSDFKVGFVVVRPTLLAEACQRWVVDVLVSIM